MSSQSIFHKYNPFRTVTWRYDRALSLVNRYPVSARCGAGDDKYVRGLRKFLLLRKNQSESNQQLIETAMPHVCFAHDLHCASDRYKELIYFTQARILARQSDKLIAEMIGTMPATIEWYEACFYNVRDRLKCHDWIVQNVLSDAALRSQNYEAEQKKAGRKYIRQPYSLPFLDMTLKLFAYFAGPVAVEFLISGYRRGDMPSGQDDLAGWFDRQWTMDVKRRSAQAAYTAEINQFNAQDLFALNARLMEIEKDQQHEGRRRSAVEQHLNTFITGIRWSVGDRMSSGADRGLLPSYDKYAAELRDSEVLAAAGGDRVSNEDDVKSLSISSISSKKE